MSEASGKGSPPMEMGPAFHPTSEEILMGAGLSFHFFVRDMEGPAVFLDAEGLRQLADAAERELDDQQQQSDT